MAGDLRNETKTDRSAAGSDPAYGDGRRNAGHHDRRGVESGKRRVIPDRGPASGVVTVGDCGDSRQRWRLHVARGSESVRAVKSWARVARAPRASRSAAAETCAALPKPSIETIT